jgi:solute carrier family 25 (mitochondrial oxoglutarate transporter), member 11
MNSRDSPIPASATPCPPLVFPNPLQFQPQPIPYQRKWTSSLLATSASSPPASPPPTLSRSMVFITSGLGGCAGWIIVHPANTLAVRMSLAAMNNKKFNFQTMIRESGGYLGLYAGLSAGVLRQVFYATSRFGLFETIRDMVHEYRGGYTDAPARVAIGAVTGGMAAYISCPMEVCVVRMSNDATRPVDQRRNYKNVFDTATRIVREEGVATFWRGSAPFVTRAMLVGVFQVATLDQFKEWFAVQFKQKHNSVVNVFCAAMSSGLIYSVATMPLEATKNRMANQKRDPTTGKLPYRTIVQTLRKVSTEEGFMSLYKGFLPYYIRCGGHTVAMFVLVQVFRDLAIQFHLN